MSHDEPVADDAHFVGPAAAALGLLADDLPVGVALVDRGSVLIEVIELMQDLMGLFVQHEQLGVLEGTDVQPAIVV